MQLSGLFRNPSSEFQIPKVIVITGPTATGKTALGAQTAKTMDGEVISADSMQIYKHMDVGTAKPTEPERLGVPHHMIDIVMPDEDYSVGRYVAEAARCADDILSRGKLPVIVGGTGLYIDSLISGRCFAAPADAMLRRELELEFDNYGGGAMLRKLSGFDALSAAKLHENDKKRIVRAFEVYQTTGKTISQHDAETQILPPRYNAAKYALTYTDRAELYRRIDARVDKMISLGLVNEVQTLLDMGVSTRCTAMQAIGYKETAAFLRGEMSMDEAIDKIKMESRRYAKRQLTWLRRDPGVKWIIRDGETDLVGAVKMIELILSVAKADGRIRAVSMEGSRANPAVPKDQYQDYDVTYYVTDITPFYNHPEWVEEHFGKPLIMQMPEAMRWPDGGGHFNYQMIFTDGNRIDLTFEPKKYTDNNEPSIILLDKDGGNGFLPSALPPPSDAVYHIKPPSPLFYYSCCNNFWWCLNNVAKGIARDELPYAMNMLNEVVRSELHCMIEWYIGTLYGFNLSVGKDGKYYFKRN